MSQRHPFIRLLSLVVAAAPLAAQQPGGRGPRGDAAPVNQTVPPSPPAAFVRTTPPTDATIRKIWDEGMTRSHAMALAQELTDVVGPRLTGSPAATAASDWATAKYGEWGIAARREDYGTWNAWRRGVSHLDLLIPRVRSLDALMLAWSPGTNGKIGRAHV